MAWKQTSSPRTLLASPALVREFATMEPAPYDRPLSEKRLEVYRRILASGEFRPVTWASVHCVETNCVYRVNGKHTSTMLSAMSPLPDFHVTVERYTADTLTDVANLYNTFDSNLASRTTADINLAFARTIPNLRTTHPKIVSLCVAALSFREWDEATLKKVPPAERAELLLDNVDFVQWIEKVLHNAMGSAYKDGPKRGSIAPLRRNPVVWAMLATYKKGPRIADEFWQAVRDETAPDREDPTRVLCRYLTHVTLASGKASGKEKKLAGNREVYAKCIHAWNAWRAKERTSLNYHAKAPLPVPSK